MSKQNGNKGRRFDRAFKEEAVRLLQTAGAGSGRFQAILGSASGATTSRWVISGCIVGNGDLLSGPRRRSRAQGPAGGAGHDRALEGGREDATGARRDHHRDGGQAARLRRADVGLARHGDIHRPPPERLTGAPLWTPRRPVAGGASLVRIPPRDGAADGLPRPGDAPGEGPRTVPQACRRTQREGLVPAMRPGPAGAGPQPVRTVRREEECRQPCPGRKAQGSRKAAKGPGQGAGPRTRAHPPADRRAPLPGSLYPLWQTPGRAGAQELRAVHRKAPGGGPRALRGRQGRGEALRRRRCGRQTPQRPRPKQAAPEGAPRCRSLHPVRAASAHRGRLDLRALPRPETGGRARSLQRPAGRGPLHPLRRPGLRRPVALRSLCRDRRGQPVARTQELSSILHLIILSDGKPGHRMSF